MNIRALSTAHSLTVFWEKQPEDSGAYSVSVNGGERLSCKSTHCQLDALLPETAYTVTVFCGDAPLGRLTARTQRPRRRLNVRSFGAKGDGKSMDRAALQAAIDACTEADEVYLPAGVYLTGALKMHSHMALYLDEGAVLQGSCETADYLPRIPSRFEGVEQECYSSVLNLGELDHRAGSNCRDVLIYGKGKIASGGQPLASAFIAQETERLREYLAENAALVATCQRPDTIPGRVRPRLINLSNCENVRISGLTLENGASWNVHMIYSRGIVTDHCVFRSEGVWNGDGWDPDSSEDCTLFACRFYTGDDAVAIKSGKNPEGNLINRPTRRIRIFDCFSDFGHGIVIGSEMSGGVEDVKIWDCDLGKAMQGFEIKATSKRGGFVRNVQLIDCTVARVLMHAVPYNNDGVPAPTQPVIENCRFDRVRILGRSLDHDHITTVCPAIELEGFEQPGHEIRSVEFHDCVLAEGNRGVYLSRCEKIVFDNLKNE